MAGNAALDRMLKALRAFGLKYPGAHSKSPWPGHKDLAVKDKTFAYLSVEGEPFSISCKLPESHQAALMLEHTSPTGWGLGKSGWVTAQFPARAVPPIAMLEAWIDESYRAVAPKKLIATLSGGPPLMAAGAKKKKKTAKKRVQRSK
ncbi:MAG TPA: MmcQ/YjbR family DNA-binding protein [Polyangiales bacterium]|nr:MmcQ/YjbR family DNA-binding protein [Polyangiales bacterium]